MTALPQNVVIAMLTVILTLGGTNFALADSDKSDVSMEDVVKAWEARAKRVQTLRFKWNSRFTVSTGAYAMPAPGGVIDPSNPGNLTVPEKTTTYDEFHSLTIDGDAIRYEGNHMHLSIDTELVHQEDVWVWSSKEYRKFMQAGGGPYPSGVVGSPQKVSPAPGAQVRLEPVFMTYRPFHPTTHAFKDFTKRFKLVAGTHIVQDCPCILLKGEPPTPTQAAVSLFLDPAREFVIMSLVREQNGKEVSRVTFLDYKRSHDEWIPVGWTAAFPNPDGSFYTTNAAQVADVAFNERIDPQVFDLEFPPGTWVNDGVSGTSHIVKAGGTLRQITKNEMFGGKTYEDYFRGTERRIVLVVVHENVALRVEGVPAAGSSDEDDPTDDVKPKHPMQVAIDDASCNQILFGKGRNEAAARDRLTTLLKHEVAIVDQVCRLTDAQKKKLDLAGRGDIARIFGRAAALRPKIQKVDGEKYDGTDRGKGWLKASVIKLCEEAEPIRSSIDSDIFDADSLFGKAAKAILTPQQAAAYKELKSPPPPTPE